MRPRGLGARDTLRMEMDSVYGNDIDETTNSIEAGQVGLSSIKNSLTRTYQRRLNLKAQQACGTKNH